MPIRDYKDLAVWQKAQSLMDAVYKTTATYPPAERYVLVELTREAAVILPAYIAQAYARGSRQEYAQGIRSACGAVAKLDSLLALAESLGFLKIPHSERIFYALEEMTRMLERLRSRLSAV